MNNLLFIQVKAERGDNFSYIVGDNETKEGAIIDPSFNTQQLMGIVESRKLKIAYVIDSHSHYDHIFGNDAIAMRYKAKIVVHRNSGIKNDITVSDGDVLKVGKIKIRFIHTPGHTSDSMCLLVDGKVLTGDTLFVGECGRTDIADGNSKDMYYSLFDKLAKLDDNIEVYPGHDYGPKQQSTIGIEKKTNYVLKERTLEEFLEFMNTP